jgi:hypothetical protein
MCKQQMKDAFYALRGQPALNQHVLWLMTYLQRMRPVKQPPLCSVWPVYGV